MKYHKSFQSTWICYSDENDKFQLTIPNSSHSNSMADFIADKLLSDQPEPFPECVDLYISVFHLNLKLMDTDPVQAVATAIAYDLPKHPQAAFVKFMKDTVFDSYDKVFMVENYALAVMCDFDPELTRAYQGVVSEYKALPVRYLQLEAMAREGKLDPSLTIGEQKIEVVVPTTKWRFFTDSFKLTSPAIQKRVDAMSVDEYMKLVGSKASDRPSLSSPLPVVHARIDSLLADAVDDEPTTASVLAAILNGIHASGAKIEHSGLINKVKDIGIIIEGRPNLGTVFAAAIEQYQHDYSSMVALIKEYNAVKWFKGSKNNLEPVVEKLLAVTTPAVVAELFYAASEEERVFTASEWAQVAAHWEDKYKDLPADWIVNCL